MKILVITHLFHPDRGGGASVFSDLCFGLTARGHEVEVLAGYPYYPEWRNKSGANLWRVTSERIHGMILHRYGFFIPSRPSALWQRLLYEISFTFSLLRSLWGARRNDLVVVYCPLMGSLLFAGIRCFLFRERLWLNVQDIPADAAKASGINKSWLFNWLALWAQRRLFLQADIISSISPVMVRRVAEIVGQEPHYYPNWLNETMEQAIGAVKVGDRREQRRSHPTLLYAGNIGKKQALVAICKVLARLPLSFEVRIFGDGAEAAGLRHWLEQEEDARFFMGEFLPERQFVEELHRADYFLITELSEAGASFIPSKLIPGIATGTPIIGVCSASGPLGNEIMQHGLGLVFEWNEMAQLAEFLTTDIRQTSQYCGWVAACLQHSERFRRNTAFEMFEKIALGNAYGKFQ